MHATPTPNPLQWKQPTTRLQVSIPSKILHQNQSNLAMQWYPLGHGKQNITMVITLDLSAVFDTVDHEVLLEIMEHFRLTDSAIKWLDKYLRPRCLKVCIGNSYSTPKELNFSVPQGSCCRANIFTCCSALTEKAIPSHITINGFADDHSIRKTYKGSDRQQEISTKQELEHTFNNIKIWMDKMGLKLNTDKTEYIQFGSWKQLEKNGKEPLVAGSDLIQMSNVVRYTGWFLDQSLTFNNHICQKRRAAMGNLTWIKSIRKYLSKDACATLVLMLCISHLDYRNALLYGALKNP